MPAGGGDFSLLHRTCKLVVLLCFLHISVTLVFYVKSLDIRFAFVPNSGGGGGGGGGGGEPHTFKPLGGGGGPQNPTKDSKTPQEEEQQQQHQSVIISSQEKGEDTKKEEIKNPAAGEEQENVVMVKPTASVQKKPLEQCPETSPLLVGPLRVEFGFAVTLEQTAAENPRVEAGGRHRPADCLSRHKVALIIPFRNREEHLKYWLYYLHPILQRQQLDYGVYVINQDGDEIFNRAKLLNVGYQEALKDYAYDCFVFSDVDLIPMDDRNVYACFSQPRHLSVSMDKFGFRLPYNQYFGGVSSMSKEQFLKINGFPNNYWGWGGEDDDIYNRVVSRGMSISRPSGVVGKCRMIRHDRDKQNEPNPQRFDLISHTRDTMNRDGIKSLSYKVVRRDTMPLYTMVTVDIGKP